MISNKDIIVQADRNIQIKSQEAYYEELVYKKYKCIVMAIIGIIMCNACSKEEQCNKYFYKEETIRTYEGYFYLQSYTDLWQDIDLYITKLGEFSNAALYALELEQPISSDPYDELLDRKYIGCFYVKNGSIYYLAANEDGYIEENNNRVIERIKSDEVNFPEQCMIVCSENGMEDITDDIGYHAYVEVAGDKRIFRYYNDYFHGSKEYLLMVWDFERYFRRFMYPDFGVMATDTAKMVMIECNVAITDGLIGHSVADIFSVTRASYLDMKQKQDGEQGSCGGSGQTSGG